MLEEAEADVFRSGKLSPRRGFHTVVKTCPTTLQEKLELVSDGHDHTWPGLLSYACLLLCI